MVSSKDVAKLAGVSQATVSRVLNNPNSVKEATREKVVEAIEQLHYHPNLIARSLVTNNTRTIGLISGPLTNGFFVETTDVIVNLATKHGYKTMVYFEDYAKMEDILASIRGNKVEGLLLSTIKLDDPLQKEIEYSGIPYMYFNRRPRSGGNYIVMDNLLAGEMITRHLLELGHHRIAYISGETDVSTFFERQVGYKRVLEEADLLDNKYIYYTNATASDVQNVTAQLVGRSDHPTAILCATDAMALVCMETLLSMGVRIPEDISLAGIDNIRISSHLAVKLTTVGLQHGSLGELAASNLFQIIQGHSRQSPRQIVLQPELYRRSTTSVPMTDSF